MDKPWLQSNDWPHVVRSNARKSVRALWLFAVGWNLISWPALGMLPDALATGNHAAWLMLAFPMIGLGLLWWAVKLTREWRRFGVTTLLLDPHPGSIGGHVGGSIDLAHVMVDSSREFVVTLACVHSHVSGSGKNRSRKRSVVWQSQGNADAQPQGRGVRLEFRFDVPADLPASEPSGGESYHYWQLRLSSDQPGIELERAFDIGVFPTAESSREIQVDTSAASRAQARSELKAAIDNSQQGEGLLEKHGLSVERRGDWLRLYLHSGRQKGLAFVALLVGVVFAGVMLFLPDEGWNTLIIRTVFGVFGFGSLAVGAYLPFNSLDVRISRWEISRVRSWLGTAIHRQQISPRDLEELQIEHGATARTGNTTTIYYELVGKGRFGSFKLIESIPDRSLVEAVRQQVMLVAGLSGSAVRRSAIRGSAVRGSATR